MKSILITVVVLYALFSLTFCSLQRKFLYFPQSASDVYGEMNISFVVDDMRLNGWMLNKGQPKALIYYGGNAESVEANIPLFEAVLSRYTVYLIPYRGYGNNAGTPAEQVLYSDAVQIYTMIKDQHDSVSLMGRSLGSGIATYVAANRQVDKLILVTPFDSIENVAKDIYWMFPVSLLIKDKFRSSERVKDITAQTYIFIAEKDRVIPRARTDQLIAQFTDQLVEVIVVTGAGHNTISQSSDYVSGLKRALD
ncbi:alpha/beta hydrolase [Photobacterium chitinilyticum]|uniref:Alpha/beta hydrolase n=1 Tax=Photobacterium chitinilyticum TaxID=2485123 RepID=A0A444JN70_9GAMM|nr:alpha/beta hydrolase [Photobacterium chitinilyticum]RWX54521.1 alpha/beta hydrolase [Photobacterium chitinilyticum]